MKYAAVPQSDCVACSAPHPVTTQREVYAFRPSRLCAFHVSLWNQADERAHVAGCPHRPAVCPRCEEKRGATT